MNYNEKKFRSFQTTENAEVSQETLFEYFQEGNIVRGIYSGGAIAQGQLLGIVDEKGCIDMRYQQVNMSGALMTGKCFSTPEILADGRIRLHEEWEWTSGDFSKGSSIVEELAKS